MCVVYIEKKIVFFKNILVPFLFQVFAANKRFLDKLLITLLEEES